MIEQPTDYEVIEAYATLNLRRIERDRAGVNEKIAGFDKRIRDLTAARNHQIAVRGGCDFLAENYRSWLERARREELGTEVAKSWAEGFMAEVFPDWGRYQ